MSHCYFSSLDVDQYKAATYEGGPVYVVAGPGSGKTHTLIARILSLLEKGEEPQNIAIITYTRKAASDLQRKIDDLLLPVRAYTLHGLAYQSLLKEGEMNEIVTSAQQQRILKNILQKNNEYKEFCRSPIEAALMISRYKMGVDQSQSPISASLYKNYQLQLEELRLVDYDDILIKWNQKLLQKTVESRFKHVLIDEAQDFNVLQCEIATKLSDTSTGFFIIGDQEQAIYGFRGSQKEYLKEFRSRLSDGGCLIQLGVNYRSHRHIVEVGNLLRKDGLVQRPYQYFDGSIYYIQLPDERSEARYIVNQVCGLTGVIEGSLARASFADIAVLYRSGYLREALIQAFDAKGLPFQISGEDGFFQSAEGEFLRLIFLFTKSKSHSILASIVFDKEYGFLSGSQYGPDKSTNSFFSFIKQSTPVEAMNKYKLLFDLYSDILPSKAGDLVKETVKVFRLKQTRDVRAIIDAAESIQPTVSQWLEYVARLDEEPTYVDKVDKITISTIHAVKGLEFKYVFVCGCEEGIIPSEKSDCDVNEERRLLYVAITRAIESCICTYTLKRYQKFSKPSRFFSEIDSPFFANHVENLTKNQQIRRQKQKDKKAQLKMF